MPSNYNDIYPNGGGAAFDNVLKNLGNAPIMFVDNIKDLSNAMNQLSEDGVNTASYDINSHGKNGFFKIGEDNVEIGTDVSSLKKGFEGKDIFIDACSVSSSSQTEPFVDLTMDFAQQTNSNVITSCHDISSNSKYDGIDTFNKAWSAPMNPKDYNNYKLSIKGAQGTIIQDLKVDKSNGMSWNWGSTDISTIINYYFNKYF